MDNLSELRTAVQDDLTVGSDSTLYSPTSIDLAINRAYRKSGGLFPWPELQDALKTTSENSNAYYDYPSAWRSNTIWKLVVDGDRYGEDPDGSPLSFDDFLVWQEDYPNSTNKKWTNQERRFFLSPVPSDGVEIDIWGLKNTTTLSSDSDTTVFSYSTPEINEAIVLEAGAILKSKNDNDKGNEFRSTEARQILATTWSRQIREQAKYEKNQPMFYVPDYYSLTGNATEDMRGRF